MQHWVPGSSRDRVGVGGCGRVGGWSVVERGGWGGSEEGEGRGPRRGERKCVQGKSCAVRGCGLGGVDDDQVAEVDSFITVRITVHAEMRRESAACAEVSGGRASGRG